MIAIKALRGGAILESIEVIMLWDVRNTCKHDFITGNAEYTLPIKPENARV